MKDIEIANKVIEIIDNSDYIDLYEDIYDELKFLKKNLRENKSVKNNLYDLHLVLSSNTYVDCDGKILEALEILNNYKIDND